MKTNNRKNEVIKEEVQKTKTAKAEPEPEIEVLPLTFLGMDYYKVIIVVVAFLVCMMSAVYFTVEQDKMYISLVLAKCCLERHSR